jgi:carbamoyltransferase
MYIVGISAFYHSAGASIICDGRIVAAAQEEWFTRKKHDSSFPINSLIFCISKAGISPSEVDFFVFYDKPFLKFDRLLESYLAYAPKGFKSFLRSMPTWAKDKLFQKNLLIDEISKSLKLDRTLTHSRLLFSEHHLSHAASAFYPSPFSDAAILTMDGVGEWATTSIGIGHNENLEIVKELHFPHSLGLLYSAFTYYCGFKVNSGEYKLMGLAPYGTPKYVDRILTNLIELKDDGSFSLNMRFFEYCTDTKMTGVAFSRLFSEVPQRNPEDEILQCHMDLAASIQFVTNTIVIQIARFIKKEFGSKNLCMAGGVALNCVSNGELARQNIFENIWVQPASGDSGGSIGAALAAYHIHLGQPRALMLPDGMGGALLGPEYDQFSIEADLKALKANFHVLSEDEIILVTANKLAEGLAVGWHQGRNEFGPRALGSRSILADPRRSSVQKQLNLKIKFRESFRPFAPAILRKELSNWFESDIDSPYMLLVSQLQKERRILTKDQDHLFGIEKLNEVRSTVPAVTHVDYSARIQTVDENSNHKFYKLLKKFTEITGCPILVNTSFNVRGEPIVLSPEDAFRCFMSCGLDLLIIGNCLLYKNEQDESLLINYVDSYELD